MKIQIIIVLTRSFNPQLAVSGNNVYVVWQEDDAITGNQDIFFTRRVPMVGIVLVL